MIDMDFLKSLDRLQVILKKKVYGKLEGEHIGTNYGDGLVFKDYKAYSPGDDFRYIDWKVYARTNKFFVKRFEEEKNMQVHILIDSSGSMNFGTNRTKWEYGAMLALGFCYLALKNNERFTVNTFSEKIDLIKPARGKNQLLSLFNFLSKHKISGKTDFLKSMDEYKKRIKHRSMIVFVSDFLYDLKEVDEVLSRYRKSEVYVIQVLDVEERKLQVRGEVILEDLEENKKLRTYISPRLVSNYEQKLESHIYKLKKICEDNNAYFISLTTNTPIFEAFYHMLK